MQIDLSGNGAPSYCLNLTNNNKNCFSIQGAGMLSNWVTNVNKPTNNPTNPMTLFLQQLTTGKRVNQARS
jgi:hypothetical protein